MEFQTRCLGFSQIGTVKYRIKCLCSRDFGLEIFNVGFVLFCIDVREETFLKIVSVEGMGRKRRGSSENNASNLVLLKASGARLDAVVKRCTFKYAQNLLWHFNSSGIQCLEDQSLQPQSFIALE